MLFVDGDFDVGGFIEKFGFGDIGREMRRRRRILGSTDKS